MNKPTKIKTTIAVAALAALGMSACAAEEEGTTDTTAEQSSTTAAESRETNTTEASTTTASDTTVEAKTVEDLSTVEKAAVSTAQKAVGLEEFPDSATNFEVTTDSGEYSSGFQISFEAPLADINEWLEESQATKDVEPKDEPPIRTFDLKVENLAEGQIVVNELDGEQGTVRIEAFLA